MPGRATAQANEVQDALASVTRTVRFGILGPFQTLDEAGSELTLGGARQRALFALLLLNAGEVVSTDRIVDEIWGAKPPRRPAHTVAVYVSNLRKALGDSGREALVTRAPGYLLELAPEALDLSRFEEALNDGRAALIDGRFTDAAERLRQGLDEWRGPPLAEFAYEAFAQTAIARLEELRLVALEERFEADLALGRHSELVPELRELVSQQPLRERPRGQLMLALYRAGRQAEALEVFQETRAALVEHLGIDPGPALQTLERRILNHDHELAAPEPEITSAEASRSRNVLSALVTSVSSAVVVSGLATSISRASTSSCGGSATARGSASVRRASKATRLLGAQRIARALAAV